MTGPGQNKIGERPKLGGLKTGWGIRDLDLVTQAIVKSIDIDGDVRPLIGRSCGAEYKVGLLKYHWMDPAAIGAADPLSMWMFLTGMGSA